MRTECKRIPESYSIIDCVWFTFHQADKGNEYRDKDF